MVRLGDSDIALDITRDGEMLAVRFVADPGKTSKPAPAQVLASAWKPGDPVWSGTFDGRPIAVQVRPVPNGFDLSHRGVETRAYVYTEREAAAARLMPAKKVADSGKAVRCPMPGLVVSIAVVEGQEVKAGETLAVVEAMKMENVLRAERDGVVHKIRAKQGDSLAVDAVILEFA
jgi:propionyl-CoA carboxylase alpha chain